MVFIFPPFLIIPTTIVLLASSSSSSSNNNNINNNNINKSNSKLTTMSLLQQQCERIAEKLQKTVLDVKSEEDEEEEQNQYWIGLAGGPGSGKSTAADMIAKLLNDKNKNDDDDDCCIVIPMDGWHIPKKQLLEKYGENDGMKRRGAPYTFDVTKLYEDLYNAKITGEGLLPIYSREISDPIPNSIQLKKSNQHKIVIVEGIYVLWKDDINWNNIYNLFDEKWFIKCTSQEEQINRLLQRSIKTWTPAKSKVWGEGLEGATARINFNDVPNMNLIQHCYQYADEIIIND